MIWTEDEAAQRLLELRPRLVRYFAARGLGWIADELADEVITRVMGRVRMRASIDSLERYALGFARNVLLEQARKERPQSLTGDEQVAQTVEADPIDSTCLEAALADFPAESRTLLLKFYGAGADGAKNKETRRHLAAELGVSMNALFLRVSKLRRQLAESVQRCRANGGPAGQVFGPLGTKV